MLGSALLETWAVARSRNITLPLAQVRIAPVLGLSGGPSLATAGSRTLTPVRNRAGFSAPCGGLRYLGTETLSPHSAAVHWAAGLRSRPEIGAWL